MLAPLNNLLQDRLVDLITACQTRGSGFRREMEALTFGIGTAVAVAPSPRSSIMFLISMERSATWRSVAGLSQSS